MFLVVKVERTVNCKHLQHHTCCTVTLCTHGSNNKSYLILKNKSVGYIFILYLLLKNECIILQLVSRTNNGEQTRNVKSIGERNKFGCEKSPTILLGYRPYTISLLLMEPASTYPCSQQPTFRPCSEPDDPVCVLRFNVFQDFS